ncbi:MAG: phosphohistidine phosphatase SixA [Planctomycetota bacterium]|jgi:phosphohistidine phosphatase
MKIYLVRHGEAVSSDVDSQRPLSDQGRADVQKVAAFIEHLRVSVQYIWHSGKLRAAQTAEILAGAVSAQKGCSSREGLGPYDDASTIAHELDAYDTDLMIVGHLPFLWNLTSLLAVGKQTADVIAFEAGAMVCLERRDHSTWQISWTIAPGLLA